ncbi:DUF4952 domain-containing protein [Leptospira noguchii]|uniref:DUF4952 domain-containing protein n=1 Tax=Leptospira noguchii TaxID=28182 RepID=UPI001147258B|nr:DUF4952 domain-containing protein [Leptospira noguchii]TQE73200.1 DUF4952 domain-containing protein [Leptospira noguchii]UOG34986.1 DUF4952 domain-containing protein [Leptospira noguchii]UOG45890.1 DUF4952 domain-containing protein [Leptospira noguchii]UOG53519.1 DUF4952 domain-containing protein [Leptospira noguchii]
MTISLKIQRKQPIVFLLVLFCAMLVSAEIVAHPPCEDFLKLHDKKPKYLEFIQCKKTQNAQIPVLQAKYRVKGKYASEVEKYLINMFGMQPLRKICCIWETVPNLEGKRYGSLKSGWKFNYSIDMGAEDQPGVNRREDWSKIKNFFVTVELDLESP